MIRHFKLKEKKTLNITNICTKIHISGKYGGRWEDGNTFTLEYLKYL